MSSIFFESVFDHSTGGRFERKTKPEDTSDFFKIHTVTGDILENKFMLTLDRLLERIYLKYLHSNPNSGGCGLIAMFIYNELVKAGHEPEIKVLTRIVEYPRPKKIELVTNILNTEPEKITDTVILNKLGVELSHVVIKLNGFYIDLSGCAPSIQQLGWSNCKESVDLPYKVLETMALNPKGWYSLFERSDADFIEVEISEAFHNNINLLRA